MEKLNLPDASVLVESLAKAEKGTKAKGISVFLAPGIDLPTGGGGYKNVDTLPSISEADDSMFYILPDGSLNYIKDNEWQTVSGGSGSSTIIADVEPTSDTVAELGQLYLDTSDDELFVCTQVEEGKTSWEFVELKKLVKFGELTFYPNWERTVAAENEDNCHLESVYTDTWFAWAAAHPLEGWEVERGYEFNYQDGIWMWNGMSGMEEIPAEDMVATTGLDITTSGDWGMLIIHSITTVDETTTKTVDVLGEHQFYQLCFADKDVVAGPFGDEHDMVLSSAIKSFILDESKITEIPDNFLQFSERLETFTTTDGNGNIWFRNIKTIGNNFLRGCHRIQAARNNLLYVGGTNLRQVGDFFLAEIGQGQEEQEWTPNYNSVQVEMNQLETCGMSMLADFMYEATLQLRMKTFGERLGAFSSFTELVVETDSFHAPAEIPNGFLQQCGNLVITNPRNFFSKVEKIGSSFLQSTQVNCPLSFPKLRTIGEDFLANATQFNSALSMPNVESIERGFLYYASAFAQPLQMNYLREINGKNFLQQCDNFVGPLTINNAYCSLYGADNNTLSVTSTTVPSYVTGVTIKGAGRQAILALGNRTSTPYRKLVDGGE